MTITEDAIDGYVSERCHELQVGRQALRGPQRHQSLVRARAIIATELRQAPWELSLPEIGKAIGKHHTSVLWLLRGGRAGRR